MTRTRTLDAFDPAATTPPVAPPLVEAPRAWGAIRDADRLQKVALWTHGSMRPVAGAPGGMEHLAARTLALFARRPAFETFRWP